MLEMLNKVLLSSDVALVCVQHALSTEKEEIMGLLIGEKVKGMLYSAVTHTTLQTQSSTYVSLLHGASSGVRSIALLLLSKVHNDGALVSIVSSVILRRLDKKPDRVEISEEQLVQATLRAEELAAELNRPLRVVGWYHSHPHITVWPSHVDLATQSMYQRMDASFVGIIFAVFLTDQSTKSPSIQITCFQSINDSSSQSRREIEMEIINNDSLLLNNLETLTQLPAILKQEEDEAYNNEVGPNESDDIINKQHNAAVRTMAIGHIVDKMSRPMLEGLVARNNLNYVRLRALKRQHQEMMSRLENMSCNV